MIGLDIEIRFQVMADGLTDKIQWQVTRAIAEAALPKLSGSEPREFVGLSFRSPVVVSS